MIDRRANWMIDGFSSSSAALDHARAQYGPREGPKIRAKSVISQKLYAQDSSILVIVDATQRMSEKRSSSTTDISLYNDAFPRALLFLK